MSIRYLDYSSSICASYTGWSSIFIGEVYEGPYCGLHNKGYVRIDTPNTDRLINQIKRK